ncbi:3-dehydroquinate dehydratase [Rahnella sp. BIGb0236]|uniref:type I 3-dehydroquinate dehydratase n=1 Tax=Rahnella TaxID=34037 RepID=UPI000BD5D294|nr:MULTISPECIES: type I 3-dehydroquinate dehydratase [Rahnella]PBI80250.1 3-dehydroquinase [Rahnella victoriana]TDS95630.1 3-dehydroquinate dehydratase [Rahnella sp. BIGb0236]
MMRLTKTLLALSLLLSVQGAAMAAQTSAPAAAVMQRHAVPITIRHTVIGEGTPKIIIPTTGTTAGQVLEQAKAIGANPDADLIEYRIDYLTFASDATKVGALGKQVAAAADGKPLILTFRTQAEGGMKTISDKAYGDLYLSLINDHFIDILDVEMFRDAKVVNQVVAAAHKAGIKVVMSSHDFHNTPSVADIVARLRKQDSMGADILKIAVMPHNPEDVVRLMDATAQIRDQYSLKPLLTMSMGGLGAVSRLSGEVFGDDLTFGMLGTPSAPGQIEAHQLHQEMNTLHLAITSH